MKPKRSLASILCEAAAVLLLTAAAFLWGLSAGRTQRCCGAIGGEYLLLLIPVIYYTGKRTVLDWAADIQEMRSTFWRR